ncbi:hypothetical protein BJ912DRAFT_1144873 [Pholiota molesta]|nr:hypothetical protein BJ912DRAFT_1144873 [Pholiota molesta]
MLLCSSTQYCTAYSDFADVFRPITGPFERYTLGYVSKTICHKCQKTETPSPPPFRVCGGCKGTYYCAPECQKADWPDHKLFCRMKRQTLDILQCVDMEHTIPVALRNSKERAAIVEEFARVHTYTFECALESIMAFAPPFDFRKKYVLVELKECADHDGNPATLYEVVDMTFRDNPPPDSTDEIMREAFLQGINPRYDGFVEYHNGNPNFWGVLVVMYRVGMLSPRPMPLAVGRPFPPPKLFERDNYKSTVKEFIGKGIVFRKVNGIRTQGILEKSGENWVWREKTPRELKNDYGVDITGAYIT